MTTNSSTNQAIDQATGDQDTKGQADWEKSFDLSALLNRNRVFSEHFQAGDLPMRPKMATILLTCVDSRVDPAHLLDLELGDVPVKQIQNELVKQACVLFFYTDLPGDAPAFEAVQNESVTIVSPSSRPSSSNFATIPSSISCIASSSGIVIGGVTEIVIERSFSRR